MNANFRINNERLLEKARNAGTESRSFDDWKRIGKIVCKGEKQRAPIVEDGKRGCYNALTGDTDYEPRIATCYGFLASQVR